MVLVETALADEAHQAAGRAVLEAEVASDTLTNPFLHLTRPIPNREHLAKVILFEGVTQEELRPSEVLQGDELATLMCVVANSSDLTQQVVAFRNLQILEEYAGFIGYTPDISQAIIEHQELISTTPGGELSFVRAIVENAAELNPRAIATQNLYLLAERAFITGDSPQIRQEIKKNIQFIRNKTGLTLQESAFYLLDQQDVGPEVTYEIVHQILEAAASGPDLDPGRRIKNAVRETQAAITKFRGKISSLTYDWTNAAAVQRFVKMTDEATLNNPKACTQALSAFYENLAKEPRPSDEEVALRIENAVAETLVFMDDTKATFETASFTHTTVDLVEIFLTETSEETLIDDAACMAALTTFYKKEFTPDPILGEQQAIPLQLLLDIDRMAYLSVASQLTNPEGIKRMIGRDQLKHPLVPEIERSINLYATVHYSLS